MGRRASRQLRNSHAVGHSKDSYPVFFSIMGIIVSNHSKLAIIMLILSLSGLLIGGSSAGSEELFSTDTAVSMFEALPTWGQTDETNIEEVGRALKTTFEKFQGADAEQMRMVIEKYLERAKSREREVPGTEFFANANVFVFNRFYFDIQRSDSGEPVPRFGGSRFGGFWVSPEVARDPGRWPLWPLEYDDKGELFIKAVFPGSSGPPYNVVGEFDYFKSRFGVRKHGVP